MDKLGAILGHTKAIQPPKNVPQAPVTPIDWEAAVGSRIATKAQPHRLERGVLTVRVTSAAWANELSLLADDILRQLRERGLPVEQLRFKVGKVRPHGPRRLHEQKVAPPPNAPLPEALRGSVESVEDDDLRRALVDAARKTLAKER